MSERQSSRARKIVNYSKFGAGEDSDDDFAASTPPVAKKPKLSNKENKAKTNDKPPKLTKQKESKQRRQSIQEKLFERELQAALNLSLSQSDHSQDSTVTPVTNQEQVGGAKGEVAILIEDDDNRAPSPILPTIVNPPVLSRVTPLNDDIEVLETSIEVETGTKPHKRATQPKKYVDDSDQEEADFEIDLRKYLRSPLTPKITNKKVEDDVDFAVDADDDGESTDNYEEEGDDDSDEDFNVNDSDSDFGGKKKTKKGTKATSTPKKSAVKNSNVSKGSKGLSKVESSTPVVKNSLTVSTATKAPTPSLAVSKTPKNSLVTRPSVSKPSPASRSTLISKSPAISSPVGRTSSSSLTASKTPKWSAPGASSVGKSPLAGVSLKSPSTGLRIGLSRNIRSIKPLHPNVKIQN